MDFISHQAEKILACYTDSSLDSCINKAEENDLEKGGEGSKGGKIIGHTKTGKPVYAGHDEKKLNAAIAAKNSQGVVDEAKKMSDEELDKRINHHYEMASAGHQGGHSHLMNLYSKVKEKRNSEKKEDKVEKSKSDDKFAKVMGEFKAGTLKSSDGSLVTKRSQAIAIAMSESGRDVEKADAEDETED